MIKIDGLTFGYRKQEIVIDNLNLEVQKGAIYGFLGANGAGKTTTLKMILGLIKQYQGHISIAGKDIKSNYPKFLSNIGSLIETPSFYGYLSASDNLKIWSNYYRSDPNRIPEVLDLLDLSHASKKKTEKYSTGMKQRLGLAAALLHNPDILILDEPTNGLDPMGILELRKVLNRLKENGKTIIISSHILSEVERMVTHLGILKNGSLIFEGTIEDLQNKKNTNIEIQIVVNDVQSTFQIIDVPDKRIVSSNMITATLNSKDKIPQVLEKLVSKGILVYEIKQTTKDLESMFLSISKENKA